jgi:hypothetical protein
MGWTTLYLKGKRGFEAEVLKHLDQSDVPFMPGSVSGEPNVYLYWVDETTTIRDFKKAIGSKTIFKYRLRVFTSLDNLNVVQNKAQDNSLTPQEEDMIRNMNDWQVNQILYKHSA